ncbi:MAG: MBL fold metallo-hydrolase [Acidobacteria bacterium]|nr:MBL fold metallo-hydrolase [Acidobacteriota bacterium]
MKITVLGAGRCVTGSKYLLQWRNFSTLLDCGLFQGPAENRRRNWAPLPFSARQLGAVVLTHAHIDHSGYLPRLVRQGFRGPIYCTPPTRALLRVLLPDAAHLQEEEARYANKEGYSKHTPALPLFRMADAKAALRLLEPAPFHEWIELNPGVRFRYRRQGHILGAASVEVQTKVSGGARRSVYFSGDVGRYGVPILKEPESYPGSDVLFVETTYGDRRHDPRDPYELLTEVITAAVRRGGVILIPAFAVDRTQEILYILHELMESGDIPGMPIFLDSPMGIEATAMYARFVSEHDAEMREYYDRDENPIFPPNLKVTPSSAESKKLNGVPGPAIIISASGMATGGRILHHLKLRLPDPANTVIFVGYQARGTKGRRLVEGEKKIKIHGQWIPVRAHIESLGTFSAHADREELVLWLSRRERDPSTVCLIHGEYGSQQAFAELLRQEYGWEPTIPEIGDEIVVNR